MRDLDYSKIEFEAASIGKTDRKDEPAVSLLKKDGKVQIILSFACILKSGIRTGSYARVLYNKEHKVICIATVSKYEDGAYLVHKSGSTRLAAIVFSDVKNLFKIPRTVVAAWDVRVESGKVYGRVG